MIKVMYFLEDSMQKDFIVSLVERIAKEEGVEVQNVIRHATHGSKAKKEFKIFVQEKRKSDSIDFDILVVAIDGNCKGCMEREREILKGIKEFNDKILCCIPEPHIEKWYLLDLSALKRAVGADLSVDQPPEKCKKDFYKNILANALIPISSLLGGSEFGGKIVEHLNFRILEENDRGFKRFVDELRRQFRVLRNRT